MLSPATEFQSALPLRGATRDCRTALIGPGRISIRAPLAGSDAATQFLRWGYALFQSALPLRGATPGMGNSSMTLMRFQSALPLRGATQRQQQRSQHSLISIRAPLAGSDVCNGDIFQNNVYFNPRSPCGERPSLRLITAYGLHFNPRSPCGERLLRRPRTGGPSHFNPRSPCGERPPTIC